jgi:hypothetical protein
MYFGTASRRQLMTAPPAEKIRTGSESMSKSLNALYPSRESLAAASITIWRNDVGYIAMAGYVLHG